MGLFGLLDVKVKVLLTALAGAIIGVIVYVEPAFKLILDWVKVNVSTKTSSPYWDTSTTVLLDTPLDAVTVIVEEPALRPFTSPLLLTVATFVLLLVQDKPLIFDPTGNTLKSIFLVSDILSLISPDEILIESGPLIISALPLLFKTITLILLSKTLLILAVT